MSSHKPLTLQLIDKIKSELSEEEFTNYKKIFSGFMKGEITFSTYQERMLEILKTELLPFHTKFTTLFRKKVIQK